jgi:hypothetical protein
VFPAAVLAARTALFLTMAVVTFAVAAVLPAAADAKRRPSCERAGSRTVAQNRLARVFEVKIQDGARLYGCLRSSGRRVALETAYDDFYTTSYGYSRVRLAGRYVAWLYEITDVSCKADCPPWYDTHREHLSVYDLRRRTRRQVDGDLLGEALVLAPSGGIAWASRGTGGSGIEIHASDRAGDRVLDSGDIPPESLRAECSMECSVISWLKDGEERFARLR